MPPYIEKYRRRWQADKPKRDRHIVAIGEWEQVYAQWQREPAEGWLTESPPALEEGDIPRNRCEGHCTPLTPTIGPCNRPF